MNIGPEIRTAAGVVRGRWEKAVAVFRGIPYAEPPVGAYRFGAPVPVQRWDGIRDALKFGPPVPQVAHTGAVMSTASGSAADGSADCLTLNVWSPALGTAGLPVMVWIHGGGYQEGGSANPHADGATLAGSGVVVVSLNYRVGVEGFAHIIGAPANRGILDQATALQWVQDNITAFGGDPGKVTVFGQSAGAGCIAALLTMPTAAGLFHRAIPQSVPGTFFTPQLAAAISGAIAAEVGARATVEELAGIAPRALIDAKDTILQKMPEFVETWRPMALTPSPFSPVVDGTVLPEAPWQALAAGAARDIDLLVGHTQDEYRLFNTRFGTEMTHEQVNTTLEWLAPGADASHGYRTMYPQATPAQLYELVHADWLFRMPSLHLADAQHAGGGPAWLYELCWSFNHEQGASHSLDFLLVFGTLGIDDVRAHRSAHPSAANEITYVSDRMRTGWVDFATTGNPGWAPYDPHTRATRVYSAAPTTQPYPEERSRRIWSSHQFDTLDLPHTE
ncbi:carboxylesterase family protein [Nocardia sp. NPDC052112]|uniref:carboxylesterase/lipase family protein n=1 Tax=Nocardia sp. NPDC052112 TaxID=3155646 RepID=UPI0034239ACC